MHTYVHYKIFRYEATYIERYFCFHAKKKRNINENFDVFISTMSWIPSHWLIMLIKFYKSISIMKCKTTIRDKFKLNFLKKETSFNVRYGFELVFNHTYLNATILSKFHWTIAIHFYKKVYGPLGTFINSAFLAISPFWVYVVKLKDKQNKKHFKDSFIAVLTATLTYLYFVSKRWKKTSLKIGLILKKRFGLFLVKQSR